jgi:hypothetical protein
VFREIQPNYNPAVGFLERVNHRRVHPNLTFRPRPKHNKVIRRFQFIADFNYFTDLHNQLTERTWASHRSEWTSNQAIHSR